MVQIVPNTIKIVPNTIRTSADTVMTDNSSPPSATYYASVNQVSIGSDNGLSPIRRQAII